MQQILKRIFDLFLAIMLIILSSPVFFVLVILIKFTSKGPVIFQQKRIGQNKHNFYILKFRTMRTDTPKNMPTHLLEDPEKFITPIGKILRKTSLDELPQLINIIRGEMSFVGPRPALFNQTDLIELRDKYKVNSIKPGVTGWAQVNGRDELDIPTKVEYDKYYYEHQSFLFDLKILIKTALSVIFAKGVIEGNHNLKTENIESQNV